MNAALFTQKVICEGKFESDAMSGAVTPIVEGMIGEYVKGALASFFDGRKRKNNADDSATTPVTKRKKSAGRSEGSISLGEDALALLQDAAVDFVEAKNKENKSTKPSPIGEKLSAKKTRKRRSFEDTSTLKKEDKKTPLREKQSSPLAATPDSKKKAKKSKTIEGVTPKALKSVDKKRASQEQSPTTLIQHETIEGEQKPATPTKVEDDNIAETKHSPQHEDAKSDRTVFVGNLPVNYDKRVRFGHSHFL